jgi:hypothetical protein
MAIGAALAAALASTPGVASADSSTDPFSWTGGMDLGDLSVPAQTTALDMQVSIDGLDLFPTVGNTASASSGPLDIAIAIGNGSQAVAGTNGIFDFAIADGTKSIAEAGGMLMCEGPLCSDLASLGNFDVAAAFGDMVHASATPGNFLTDIAPAAAAPAAAPSDLDPFQDLFGDTGINTWTPSADSFLASIDPTLAANFDTSADNFDSLMISPGGAFEFLAHELDPSSFSFDPALNGWFPVDAIGDLATGLDYSLGPTLDGSLLNSFELAAFWTELLCPFCILAGA